MTGRLTGRRALVTGGASGIGAACCRELAARGGCRGRRCRDPRPPRGTVCRGGALRGDHCGGQRRDLRRSRRPSPRRGRRGGRRGGCRRRGRLRRRESPSRSSGARRPPRPDAGGVAVRPRREPHGHVPHLCRGCPDHGERRPSRHHRHPRLGRRQDPHGGRVLGLEGCCGDVHAVPGPSGGRPGHPGERRGAGVHRDADARRRRPSPGFR